MTLTAHRVHYRHDNPAYVHPITKQTVDPEGLIEDFDEIIADTADEAQAQSKLLHWNDVGYEFLRSEEFTVEVPNA